MLLNLKTQQWLNESHSTLFNRSFRYGDGIFETIKISFGKVVHEELHLSRILDGLSVLGLSKPENLQVGFLQQCFEYFSKEQDLTTGTLRIYFFRGGAGTYLPENDETEMLAHFSAAEEDLFILNQVGLKLGIYRDISLHYSILSPLKTCNALPYTLAARFAKENGFDEVLLLDREGFVAEAVSHNVLTLQKGELYAPSIYQGGVEGVMLTRLTQIAAEIPIHLHRSYLSLKDIEEAEAVFLSNATGGIKWVAQFKDKKYDSSIGHSILDKLNEHIAPIV